MTTAGKIILDAFVRFAQASMHPEHYERLEALIESAYPEYDSEWDSDLVHYKRKQNHD